MGRYAEWVDFTADLMTRPSGRFPRTRVRSKLVETFQTQVSWNWKNADGAFGFEPSHPIKGWPSPSELVLWERHMAKHPLLCWFRRTGDPRPWSVGRVPRRIVAPHGFDILRDLCGPVGVDEQLSIPYELDGEAHRAYVLARTGEDFSDEDLDLARRIQPLLAALGKQCTLLQGAYPTGAVPAGLTGRELAVLQLLREGSTARAIGHRLGISTRTVHTHLANLYRKLGVNDRLQAVMVAQQLGIPSASREAPESPVGYALPPAAARNGTAAERLAIPVG
ncbi:response regulator transcription factor [Nocardioides sp.]|uniref:response regulator transcription factor n=1 Tax=Nocardioides sp. TaxID=35761 RepID=UPI002ED4F429